MSRIKSPGDRFGSLTGLGKAPRMRTRFEFNLYRLAADDAAHGVDPTLALMGAQGWELRGIAYTADGSLTLALQRPLDEEMPLPDAPTLAASLDEPLAAPALADLELVGHAPAEASETRLGAGGP